MKQWFSESMNHWINQTTNQWINEPADQPLKQTMNKSSNESLNHWTNESINQWLNESAATYLGYLCSDLPPSQLTSSLRAAVTMRLATSSCNPPCQDRRNITDAFLHAAVPMRFVTAGCNPRIAGAPHQIDQCSRSADTGTSTAQIRRCSDFLIFFCNFSVKFSGAVSSLTFWRANRALATVLCTFCRQFLQIDPRTRGNRDPTSATTEATLPDKTQGFAPENVFTREFTRVRTVTLPNYLMMGGWHDDVVDMMPWQSSVTWKFAS